MPKETSDLLGSKRPDTISETRRLLDKARTEGFEYHPSPVDWRKEVLYFLLPDRFSDGNENSRPLLTRDEIIALRREQHRPDWNWQNWAESGKRWQGGTINGIRGKLDYLKGLGITTIWVGPVFKQRVRKDTYHGYGIQDFLEIDPRFGTRRDLIDLVKEAHSKDMRIILDVIMNHSGDNWGYVRPHRPVHETENESPDYLEWPNFYGNPNDPDNRDWRLSWKNEREQGFTSESSDIQGVHDGVWPRDLQDERLYTRAGDSEGSLGRGDISDTHAEHKRADFANTLKDFATDLNETIGFLSECYKYWIALTDCDGFRIDTVKHVSVEEARAFCGAIKEFSESIGKNNFILIGELAGGDDVQDFYIDQLAVLESNLDAALDIGNARTTLHNIAKGLDRAERYFEGFQKSSEGFASHRTIGDRHVSVVDDHDHVTGRKVRFSAEIPDDSPAKDFQTVVASAIQLFTLGIPCIYYGTEQAFAGPAQSQLDYLRSEGWIEGAHADRYLREAMFGPEHPIAFHSEDIETQVNQKDTFLPGFGPFGTAGKHCFDTNSPAYKRIAALCKTRDEHKVLYKGRQYLRQIRTPGTDFIFPESGELIAWSRILDNDEAVCIVNPNGIDSRGGDVVVSAELWWPGIEFTVIGNTAQAAAGDAYNGTHPIGSVLQVKGRSHPEEPVYLEIRDIGPAEVLLLIKKG